MALKRITPGLSDKSLVTSLNREYKDLDLSFAAKPGTEFPDGITRGDVYKKADVRAIEQSVNNILLTNNYDKPFQPLFGADLTQLLFELNTDVSVSSVRKIVKKEIEKHEPRVEVMDVEIFDPQENEMVAKGKSRVFPFSAESSDTDRYSLIIYVHCRILNTGIDVRIPVNMNRLR